MCGILFNIPSKEFIGQDVRQYCLLKFEELNLLDKIEEKHPQSMEDAVRYLICNLNQEEIDEIYESSKDKYENSNHFYLGCGFEMNLG